VVDRNYNNTKRFTKMEKKDFASEFNAEKCKVMEYFSARI
jgi:hypothetical protein